MRPLSLTIVAALATFAASALADIAPPPNYVESCTVSKQQRTGEDCRECGTYYAEHDKCDKTLGKEGFSRRCRTSGASVWKEVWCRSAQAAPTQPDPDPHPTDPNYAKPPPGPVAIATDPSPAAATDPSPQQPPPVPARSGCGSCSVGSSPWSASALLAAAVGGLLLAVRRPRR